MTPTTDAPGSSPRSKPRLALAIATVLGVGRIPIAPGTFGSLAGIFVAVFTHPVSFLWIISLFVMRSGGTIGMDVPMFLGRPLPVLILVPSLLALLVVALLGVWSASRVSEYAGAKDPQYVVIDEVSGMHLTLVLALMPLWLPTRLAQSDEASTFALYFALSLLNWKYLLAGFILFRVFDIWKPFPIRRLEKLRGGWGIMADDWMAGVYAAVVLRIALHFGLV
jgi:phosphatidylglycerophosphatase A